MRSIQHGQTQFAGAAAQQPGRTAEKIVIGVYRFRGFEFGEHAGIARDERGGLDALGGQSERQRAGHVGKAAGFYQRENLRGDGENANS